MPVRTPPQAGLGGIGGQRTFLLCEVLEGNDGLAVSRSGILHGVRSGYIRFCLGSADPLVPWGAGGSYGFFVLAAQAALMLDVSQRSNPYAVQQPVRFLCTCSARRKPFKKPCAMYKGRMF